MQKKKQGLTLAGFVFGRARYGWMRFVTWVKKNLRALCVTGLLALPVLVMFFGDGAASDGRSLYFGGANWIFLGVELALALGLAASSKVSAPLGVPLPERRFTRHDGEQAWIEEARVQELVLYMEDLEDWFYDNYYTDE